MSLTLKETITATQTTIDVNGTDALSNGDLYEIENEQVFIVTATAGDIQPGQTAWQRLNVQRGQLGTTEVGHTAGTAVTLVDIPLGAGGGVVTVYQQTTTLTNAQIKALPTTPIQVVPAQGAGTFLKLIDSLWAFNTTAGAYTNVNVAHHTIISYQLAVGTGAATPPFTEAYSGFLSSPGNALIAAGPRQDINGTALEAFWIGSPSDYGNRPLVIEMSNGGSGNLTGGNAANTLKVTVWYGIFEV